MISTQSAPSPPACVLRGRHKLWIASGRPPRATALQKNRRAARPGAPTRDHHPHGPLRLPCRARGCRLPCRVERAAETRPRADRRHIAGGHRVGSRGAAVRAVVGLPNAAPPGPTCWPPWRSTSSTTWRWPQAYRFGDLGQVYPIARGTAPLMTAGLATAVAGRERSVPMAGPASSCWRRASCCSPCAAAERSSTSMRARSASRC